MLRFDTQIQRQVISAALDDFSPNDTLEGLHGGQYGDSPDTWREAVIEFIESMLLTRLIAPLQGRENYKSKSAQEIRELLRQGDPGNGLDTDVLWDAMHFSGTDKLVELLQGMGLASWEAAGGNLSSPLKVALAHLNVVSTERAQCPWRHECSNVCFRVSPTSPEGPVPTELARRSSAGRRHWYT